MLARSLFCFAALLVLVLAAMAWQCVNDPAFRYRTLGDKQSLRPAIARHIDNGDTLVHVRSILGVGGPDSHTKTQSWTDIQLQSRGTDGFAERYPDDILPTDTFVAYSGFPTQFVIQFRDDRVVNLPKDWLVKAYIQGGG